MNEVDNIMTYDAYWGDIEKNAKPVLSCDECGEDIYPGEIYYKIDGDCICEECIVRYMNKHYKVEAYED